MHPILLLGLACAPPADDEDRPPRGAPPGPAASDDAPDVTVEDVAGLDDPSAWLFDDTVIHRIEITLPDSSVTALGSAPYEYVPADVVIDGLYVDTVGARLRGKIGSFRNLSGKPKWRIDFDAYVHDRDFYGLGSISLNNAVVDCGYMKEATASRVFAALGVPASRVAWADVTVNGADYGLYLLVETQDDELLDRHWDDGSGNLYDGKYLYYSDGSYQLLDFSTSLVDLYVLEEGTDVGNADIRAVADAIAAGWGNDAWSAQTGAVIDWDAVHRTLVAEQWVGHVDGYAMNTNNYRVYFDPADGKAELIPWDLDYGFIPDSWWGMSWSAPRGLLAYGCFADATCAAAHREAVAGGVELVDSDALLAWFDDRAALTLDRATNDPRRECDVSNVAAYRDWVRGWVASQNDSLKTFWRLP